MLNAAGGIGLQEVADEGDDLSEGSSSEGGSISNENILPVAGEDGIPDFILSKCKGPIMNIRYNQVSLDSMHSFDRAQMIYFLWVLCRKISSTSDHTVPAFHGFVSTTGLTPKSLTTTVYYPMINEPITDYKVVRVLLARSHQNTRLVGQKYTIITFDLGVVMKAMPIIWDKPEL